MNGQIFLDPVMNFATEGDGIVLDRDVDVLRIQMRATLEGGFNLRPDGRQADLGLDRNHIDHIGNTMQSAHQGLGCLSLMVPDHLTAQGDHPILCGHLNRTFWNRTGAI